MSRRGQRYGVDQELSYGEGVDPHRRTSHRSRTVFVRNASHVLISHPRYRARGRAQVS